jgi:shikimate 5-dehydrogenase
MPRVWETALLAWARNLGVTFVMGVLTLIHAAFVYRHYRRKVMPFEGS